MIKSILLPNQDASVNPVSAHRFVNFLRRNFMYIGMAVVALIVALAGYPLSGLALCILGSAGLFVRAAIVDLGTIDFTSDELSITLEEIIQDLERI